MKRLIITGFPCPASAWKKLFPKDDDQKILSLADVLERSNANDLRVLSRVVREEILSYQPESVVMHDFGVALGLMALISARKKDNSIAPKVLLFNGAFRGFDILKAPHPLRAQFTSWTGFSHEVTLHGGSIDPRLRSHFSRIKSLYRQVILGSLLGRLQKFERSLRIDLGNDVRIIASINDPYIPLQCLEQIQRDFSGAQLIKFHYGHFPYSTPSDIFDQYITGF